MAALCCATGADGEWRGAYSDDDGQRPASARAVAAAVALATRVGDREVDGAPARDVLRIASGARSAVVVSTTHENAGRVVLLVLRDGVTNAGAKSRVETLSAFAHNAALIVSNALLHEERAVALARQVDLNRQKSDFVAAVSHELRTPLAVMLGSVHTLERLDGRMTTEQREQLFDMTVEQGGRLQRLIDELLLVAAAEHSNVQLQCEPVVIADLFASIAADTAASTAGRLTSHGTVAADLLSDASKIERILLNLVENAAKYAPAGPIELRAQPGENDIQFTVVDHGPGIPADERERVFERFVQLDQSSTRRQGGTGLGLHLCRQLAELVDGHMTLTETPGGGCTFALTVPMTPAPTTEAPVASAVEDESGGFPFANASVANASFANASVANASFANVMSRPAELGGPRPGHSGAAR